MKHEEFIKKKTKAKEQKADVICFGGCDIRLSTYEQP